MTVLELRFPAGRYHATPWGRHVNEGAIEWPPSPWRILRALIATWHLKARQEGEISEATLRSLCSTLAADAPEYLLPPAAASHTRHYMPVIEGKNEKTTKIFDTFIQLKEKEAVLVAWKKELPAAERDALQKLAERLSYFGRAESLVEARLTEWPPGKEANAKLLSGRDELPEKSELVRLLAPMTSAAYAGWLAEFTKKK